MTDDPYLDRYTLPMSVGLATDELRPWRQRVQAAWEVLVRHHRWAAGPIAEGISAIVPLTPQADTDLISATSPAAFGAVATSWPPDPVTLAETLVHEFQHVKLCGLMDMVPLASAGAENVYAPWRQDPRPASGLLQGIYAHLGIVRFWRAQRHAETHPDDILRAQVQFARWRQTIDSAVTTLRQTGCLTSAGVRFAEAMRAKGRELAAGSVPEEAQEVAREVALDHRLNWQMRHVAAHADDVASAGGRLPRRRALPGSGTTHSLDRGGCPQDRLGRKEPTPDHALPGARGDTASCTPIGLSRSASLTACCSGRQPSPRFRHTVT